MDAPVPAPIVGRPIRVALVGCGRIADKHLEAIRAHGDAMQLVAVCDVDPAARARATAGTGATAFADLDATLRGTDADLFVLATPSGLHADQAVRVAAAGRHVVTEKPMATRWEDGLRMVEACDRAGVRLFVVKQNRRNPTIRLLRDAVQAGRFGRIHMINVNVLWTRPQDYYDAAPWRGTWALDGGAFMNQASHYVDLLTWIGGPVGSVHAFTATLARRIEAEDTGVVNLRWRSGALGSMSVTMLTYPRNLEGSITVLGERGTVRIGGVAVNEIQEWSFADRAPADAEVESASYETTSVYGFGHPLYYDNVVRTLRGESEPETDGREGLRSLELLVAIQRSARDGVVVQLPLDP